MPGFGPSRHFAAMQHFGLTWSEADINWQIKPADSVENDPKPPPGQVRRDRYNQGTALRRAR